jgi:hypothetical protein
MLSWICHKEALVLCLGRSGARLPVALVLCTLVKYSFDGAYLSL